MLTLLVLLFVLFVFILALFKLLLVLSTTPHDAHRHVHHDERDRARERKRIPAPAREREAAGHRAPRGRLRILRDRARGPGRARKQRPQARLRGGRAVREDDAGREREAAEAPGVRDEGRVRVLQERFEERVGVRGLGQQQDVRCDRDVQRRRPAQSQPWKYAEKQECLLVSEHKARIAKERLVRVQHCPRLLQYLCTNFEAQRQF
jgi:hypothetical protein